MNEKKSLKEYTEITIETDAENPVTIAVITADTVYIAAGYRARMTPVYD